MRDIRVAAVVSHAPINEKSANLNRIAAWAARAADQGAGIACFPEMSISGYTTRAVIVDGAEPVPGPSSETLLGISQDVGITILAGLAETAANGRVYATHLVVRPNGTLGVYRKTHLAPPETSQFKAANTVPIFEWQHLRFGLQLCYEAHFPDLTTRMVEAGADIIFLPHASPRGTSQEKFESWRRHLSARAFDNGVFVVACNQAGDNGAGLTFPGVAVAFGPSGEVLDRLICDDEAMLIVDLKQRDLEAVRKHRMRYFFPNRRPNLYRKPIIVEKD